MLEDSIFLRALARQSTERTPVWIMRQAGRYLPEYRQTRQKAGDFMTLCKTPELACEVTLQPLRRFRLDAAILFSDILTIPDAMGLGLHFIEGEGPQFHHPLKDAASIQALPGVDVIDTLSYVFDAARLIRAEMPAHLPLIGFSGSPWTLACYMREGSSSRDFSAMKTLLYDAPAIAHHLLSRLADVIGAYLIEQVKAGANALMLFDTWGGLLSTRAYVEFSLRYMTHIIQQLKAQYPAIPIIVFTKSGGQWLSSIAHCGCDAVGLDWTVDLAAARELVGERVALQGNLDPAVLRASPAVIFEEVKRILTDFGSHPGHIFNLGHGITPDVPPEHVTAMIEAVATLSARI